MKRVGANSAVSGKAKLGRPSRTQNRAVALDACYRLLLAHPDMPASELAALVGCDLSTASKAADKLAECMAGKALMGLIDGMSRRMEELERRVSELEGIPAGLDAASRMLLKARVRHQGARPTRAL